MRCMRNAANLLRTVGMHPKYKGYAYVLLMLQRTQIEPESMYNISSGLYPMVMEKYGVSRAAVERCVRFAIKRTWETGNVQRLEELFGDYETGCIPTNREFIAVMTECIICRRTGKLH